MYSSKSANCWGIITSVVSSSLGGVLSSRAISVARSNSNSSGVVERETVSLIRSPRHTGPANGQRFSPTTTSRIHPATCSQITSSLGISPEGFVAEEFVAEEFAAGRSPAGRSGGNSEGRSGGTRSGIGWDPRKILDLGNRCRGVPHFGEMLQPSRPVKYNHTLRGVSHPKPTRRGSRTLPLSSPFGILNASRFFDPSVDLLRRGGIRCAPRVSGPG